MSDKNDKEISNTIIDDIEILSENQIRYDHAFKIVIVGNQSN